MDAPGLAVLADLDGAHRVEPQQREVGLVVAGQRLAVEVGVDQPQAAEAVRAGAAAPDVGQGELAGVADHDPLDVALAVEQHADLAADLAGDLGEVARQLGRDHLVGVDAPPVGAAQGVELGGLEAEGVAEDVVHQVACSIAALAPTGTAALAAVHLDRAGRRWIRGGGRPPPRPRRST